MPDDAAAALTANLGASEAADGARAFARHYLAARFGGRDAELAALDAWLVGDARFALVVAEAGRGKSALLVRWAAALATRGRAIVWVPVSLRFGTTRGAALREVLGAALGADREGGGWIEALRRASVRGDAPIIVLDGIDEAQDDALVDDLAELAAPGLGGVKVVVAARRLVDRDAAGWSARLGWAGAAALPLPPLSRDALADLLDARGAPAPVLTELARITEGDPMTASLVADELAAERAAGWAAITADRLAHLDAGLAGVFERWWREHAARSGAGAAAATTEALLGALACALAPAPPSLLADVIGAPAADVDAALAPLDRFVVRDVAGAVALAHPRLGHFFRDRLDDARRAALDRAFADATRRDAAAILRGDPVAADRAAYVVPWHAAHLERAVADPRTRADELDALVHARWLDAWERLEGGATGFLGDLARAWRLADAAIAAAPADARLAPLARQVRYLALRDALRARESSVSPALRAALVAHGLRPQRAAIASLAAIASGWDHSAAVGALLPELDDDGLYAVLAAGRPEAWQKPDDAWRWPVQSIARRLLARGDVAEAARWILGGPGDPSGVIARVADAHDAFPTEVRAALLDAAVAAGMTLAADPSTAVELLCSLAPALDPPRRAAVLARAEAVLRPELEHLYVDDYEGPDPRLVVAEALADAGRIADARGWLELVATDTYPHLDGPPHAIPTPALVAGHVHAADRARAHGASELAAELRGEAEAHADAIARLPRVEPMSVIAAQVALVAGVELAARAPAVERILASARAIGPGVATPLVDLARHAPEHAPAIAGAVVDLIDHGVAQLAAATAGDRYGWDYGLSQRAAIALVALAPSLAPADAARAVAALWDRLRRIPSLQTVQRWHIIAPASAAAIHAPADVRARFAEELAADAARDPDATPRIHDLPAWTALYDRATRTAQLAAVLRRRRLADPRGAIHAFVALAKPLDGDERQRVLAHAARISCTAAPGGGPDLELVREVIVHARGDLWRRLRDVIEAVAGARPSIAIGWSAVSALAGAPTPDDAARVARLALARLDALSFGGIGSLLAAVPVEEAEAFVETARAIGQVSFASLPPRARGRALEAARTAALAAESPEPLAILVRDARAVLPPDEHAALAAELARRFDAAFADPAAALPANAPAWAALKIWVYDASAEQLGRFPLALYARDASVASSVAFRWHALDRFDQIDALACAGAVLDEPRVAVIAIAAATSPDALAQIARDHPSFRAYGWFLDAIAARGWAGAYAELARAFDTPDVRLRAWTGLWPHLDADARAALDPAMEAAARAEQVSSSNPWSIARLLALDALGPAAALRLWAVDGAIGGGAGSPTSWLAAVAPYLRTLAGDAALPALADAAMSSLAWFVPP